jgi:hypothetical protein
MISHEQALKLGLGRIAGLEQHIKPYMNGRDITDRPRRTWVIDLEGLSAKEVMARFPDVYQWVFERVKPERDVNREEYRRLNWWVFGRKHTDLRSSLADLNRYAVTSMTAKHRVFTFLDSPTLPDQGLISIALDDALYHGILSSRIHVTWALAQGGTLEDRPRYNNSRCFETFPFPDCTSAQAGRIRELAERLDAHRKARQAEHPGLTLTGMYNVLEKLRGGGELTAKERVMHEQGLVSVLRQLHDELDEAVAAAYGWPAELAEPEVLARLAALNVARAAEEARGVIRWLRPEFQARGAGARGPGEQGALTLPEATPAAAPGVEAKRPWPKTLPERMRAVREALTGAGGPVTADALARRFSRVRAETIGELLATLAALGHARALPDGRYGLA